MYTNYLSHGYSMGHSHGTDYKIGFAPVSVFTEVEIQQFHACTMKNMQHNPYLWPNCQNVHVFLEIGVEEHDGNVRF